MTMKSPAAPVSIPVSPVQSMATSPSAPLPEYSWLELPEFNLTCHGSCYILRSIM